METSQRTKVKNFIYCAGRIFFVLLAVATLYIMFGPTFTVMAARTGQYMEYPRLRMAVLPGCPPESYACRSYSQPSTTTPAMNTTTPEVAEGTSPSIGGDTPSAPNQGTPGDLGAGSPTGDGSQDESPLDGDTQGGLSETSGVLGNGGTSGGKSLREIIQEGLSFLNNADFQPLSVTSNQCEYIAKGIKISNDDDNDGLAQIFSDGNLSPLLQEDYYKTDPSDPDTDYDSYYDGEEVCNGADPLHPSDIKNIDWNLVNRLKGKIVIQTERRGEAWYIYPTDRLRYYLRNGAVAYKIMRFLSLGITDKDLEKIPVGTEPGLKDKDSDGDGLSDKMEEGLKTDPKNPDTDGDGISDGDEVLARNSNPFGSGVLAYDKKIIERLRGKILLQVESRGEAWYISPADGKRYYMKDGDAAYQIMRFLSLGILNKDIGTMPIGTLVGKIK